MKCHKISILYPFHFQEKLSRRSLKQHSSNSKSSLHLLSELYDELVPEFYALFVQDTASLTVYLELQMNRCKLYTTSQECSNLIEGQRPLFLLDLLYAIDDHVYKFGVGVNGAKSCQGGALAQQIFKTLLERYFILSRLMYHFTYDKL